MTAIGHPPTLGQLVRIRQRRYLVEHAVPPPVPGDATLVRLSCVDATRKASRSPSSGNARSIRNKPR